MAEYAHPETLVLTNWVAQHANDSNVRLVEVDVGRDVPALVVPQLALTATSGEVFKSQSGPTVVMDSERE